MLGTAQGVFLRSQRGGDSRAAVSTFDATTPFSTDPPWRAGPGAGGSRRERTDLRDHFIRVELAWDKGKWENVDEAVYDEVEAITHDAKEAIAKALSDSREFLDKNEVVGRVLEPVGEVLDKNQTCGF